MGLYYVKYTSMLLLKVREHCLSLILNAVQNNAEECVCNVNKRQIEKVASQMEHSLLLSSKVVGSYKLAVNKTVSHPHIYTVYTYVPLSSIYIYLKVLCKAIIGCVNIGQLVHVCVWL